MAKQRLEGKRALITAAGQGIGRASAIAMADDGAHVVATDISEAALAELDAANHANIETRIVDALDADSINAAVDHAKPDVLFNCAGFVHHGTILDATDDEWAFAFDLNVKSMFRTIRAALPGMIDRGNGSIINMSSACSSIIGAPNRFVYGATKAAVIGLTKSVAIDFITKGIRCNCICPGTVQSPSLEQRLHTLGKQVGGYEEARKQFIARQPMGRIASAEEIAALTVYLASDESAFITGQPHVIDGGWSG